DVGAVERVEIRVVEAGTLAELPVPGLEGLSRATVHDDLVDPRPDLLHLLEVGELHRAGQALARQIGFVAAPEPTDEFADDVRPAVHDEVLLGRSARG